MKDRARQAAIEAGEKYYENGVPCKHGHIGLRQTSNTGCLECIKKWRQENRELMILCRRRWREENPEKSRASTANWAANNPDKNKEKNRRWHLANKDRNNARSRKWQLENHEHVVQRNKKWKRNNRDKVSSYTRNRRALSKCVDGLHTADDIAKIKVSQKNRCAYCRISLAKTVSHVDHIVPIKLGGSNHASNLQLLCQSCNCSKGGKHPIEYAQFIGMLV